MTKEFPMTKIQQCRDFPISTAQSARACLRNVVAGLWPASAGGILPPEADKMPALPAGGTPATTAACSRVGFFKHALKEPALLWELGIGPWDFFWILSFDLGAFPSGT